MRNSVGGLVDGCTIEIYDRAIKDDKKSEEAGYPVFNTSIYIRKKVPNSRDLYDQPIKSTDRVKYEQLFAAFEKGEKAPTSGWPVDEWPAIDVASVQVLKSIDIHTVEGVAAIADATLHRLPPGMRALPIKAQRALNEHREKDKRIEELEKSLEELKQQMSNLAPEKRKPGRPKKIA